MIRLSRGPVPGSYAGEEILAPPSSETIDFIDDYFDPATTYLSTQTPVQTDTIDTTVFLLMRAMFNGNSSSSNSPNLEFEHNNAASTFCVMDLGNVKSTTTTGAFAEASQRVRVLTNQYLSQEVVPNDNTAYSSHHGIVAFDIAQWVDDTDYFNDEGGIVTVPIVADTDYTIQTVTFDIQETGDHLVFWVFEVDAGNAGAGDFRYTLAIDGSDPYNIESGSANGFTEDFTGEAGDTEWQRAFSGFCVVNFATTGNKVFTLTGNAVNGLENTTCRSLRGRFFVIPTSKFNMVDWTQSTERKTTRSTTYQDTGLEVSMNTENPVLLLFCSPVQVDASTASNTICATRFFKKGAGTAIPDGEGYGTVAQQASDIGTAAATISVFNFVILSNGLNDTIQAQFARRLGASTADVTINTQDNGSGHGNGFLAAIELAMPS